ncbi:MAG: C45 family autoproteolytic acyltransferase/hydrolase [Isosphaeraceae bacterium]
MPSPRPRLIAAILVASALLGRAHGQQPGSADFRPDPATVQRFGAGYCYPQAGWTVLHIEGEPYERGYQHGRLLAPQIARLVESLAVYRSTKAPEDAWRDLRLIANALFLRKFDPEYIEEMKGIADGAAAAGAKFRGRLLDFLDVVTLNADIETTFLDEALDATATGLEGKRFREPAEGAPKPPRESHCSAFAATGPATADGQVVFGHITMWNLYHAVHYNVWLDIKPSRGNRVVMQTYPGGLMSGLDYYMNDKGLIVCETTITQTGFDIQGLPLVDRIRRALQYSDSIDGAVRRLREGNNGLYSNEWLLADVKTGEIAMFELGTHKSRLWRSSRDEWFGGTKGFYWGCNNAKDLQVRLESMPSASGRPENVVFHPSDRDRTWLRLFDQKKGSINAEFGFLAFTTPPLAAARSLDAKFTTTAMARDLSCWAKLGPPLGRVWEPTDAQRREYPDLGSLIPNDWTTLRVVPPGDRPSTIRPAEDLAGTAEGSGGHDEPDRERPPAWHGTILPAADGDAWLASAFASYEHIISLEQALKARSRTGTLSNTDREELDAALLVPAARYLSAMARRGGKDIAIAAVRADLRSDEWYDISAGRGVLILSELRKRMGDEPFLKLMDEFGREHAGRTVSTAEFFAAAEKVHGRSLSEQKDAWLGPDAASHLGDDVRGRLAAKRFWLVDAFEREPESSLIVYGTLAEAEAQREAAGLLQRKLAARWFNATIPIKSDQEVSEDELKSRHILLIGRPATNRITARLARALPVQFGPASFLAAGKVYAHPDTALAVAGPNPAAGDRSVVLFAGLSATGTYQGIRRFPDNGGAAAEMLLMEAGRPIKRRAIPVRHEPSSGAEAAEVAPARRGPEQAPAARSAGGGAD